MIEQDWNMTMADMIGSYVFKTEEGFQLPFTSTRRNNFKSDSLFISILLAGKEAQFTSNREPSKQ